MANLIEQAFDATKGLIRSVFKGRPNLFTTSDLNRQLEALKFQTDKVGSIVGPTSDINLWVDALSSPVKLGYEFTYLIFNGVDFAAFIPTSRTGLDTIEIPQSTTSIVYVAGRYKTVTYADDPTHEIAGARFEDNTSMPAADAIVIDPLTVEVIVSSLSDGVPEYDSQDIDYDFVFPIAKIVYDSVTGSYGVCNGTTQKNHSYPIENQSYTKDIPNVQASELLRPGIPYERALSILQNKISRRTLDSDWTTESTGAVWCIKNGSLFVRATAGYLSRNKFASYAPCLNSFETEQILSIPRGTLQNIFDNLPTALTMSGGNKVVKVLYVHPVQLWINSTANPPAQASPLVTPAHVALKITKTIDADSYSAELVVVVNNTDGRRGYNELFTFIDYTDGTSITGGATLKLKYLSAESIYGGNYKLWAESPLGDNGGETFGVPLPLE